MPETKPQDPRLFICLQGGFVYCVEHLGHEGKSYVLAEPERAEWLTSMNLWAASTPEDREYFLKECGAPMVCESCGYSPDALKAVA